MPSAVRRAVLLALACASGLSILAAQPEPKKDDKKADKKADKAADPKDAPKAEPPKAPTAEDAAALREKFRAERGEAEKAGFPADTLARADGLAKRAEAALKAGDARAAGRYFRDARWQLPYVPAGLPPHVARVFGENRMRHPDRVNAVAYSPDGNRLASASRDGTVKVWDLGNGRELLAYRGHLDQPDDPTAGTTNKLGVSDVAFGPDGKSVASVAGSQVHLWDPATGKQIKVLFKLEKADRPLKAVAFRSNGAALAVGGDDGILRVIEVETGKVAYASPPRNARIEKVAYSPNGKLIGVADNGGAGNGNVAVYAPGASNPIPMSVAAVQPPDAGAAFSVGFTADSAAVFVAAADGKVKLFAGPNPDGTAANNTSVRLREFAAGERVIVYALAVGRDGKTLVTGGSDKLVRVWEVSSGKQLRAFQGHMQAVLAVALRPDGGQVASASDDGAIRLWDLAASDDHRAFTDAADALWSVAFSPDGKRMATGGADKTVRVYDPESGKLEAALAGHAAAVTAVAFFPDGNRLVSAGGDRVLRVWDIPGKRTTAELKGHELPVLAAAVSADGKLVASGSADRTVRGWDPEGGKQLWSWSGKSAVVSVAARRDGKVVAAGTADGGLVILDVSAGSPKEVFSQSAHTSGTACVAYSPDGSRLATVGGDGAVRVWASSDTGALTPLLRFDGQGKPGASAAPAMLTGVAFSPDGRYVASAGADAVVRVWDIQTKGEVRGLRGHTEWATAVAFSPDGRLLASTGADKAARVFELAPQESSAAVGHLLKVNAVAVSPDGSVVATASIDQTIKLWDRATGKEITTLVGGGDTPLALTFLGNDALVLGTKVGDLGPGRVQFWSRNPGRMARANPTGQVYSAVAAADGSRVAVWAARPAGEGKPLNTAYEVYDAKGELVASLADKDRKVSAATFTPDLAWAVSGDESGTVRVWDLAKKDRVGGDWPLFANPVGDIGVTPDKKYIVAVDQPNPEDANRKDPLVKVADVAKRETVVSASVHKAGVQALVVSPAGDTFATVGLDHEVKVWSLKDLKELKELRSWKLPIGVAAAAYTPDGKQLVTANADGTAFLLQLP